MDFPPFPKLWGSHRTRLVGTAGGRAFFHGASREATELRRDGLLTVLRGLEEDRPSSTQSAGPNFAPPAPHSVSRTSSQSREPGDFHRVNATRRVSGEDGCLSVRPGKVGLGKKHGHVQVPFTHGNVTEENEIRRHRKPYGRHMAEAPRKCVGVQEGPVALRS